MPEPTAPNRSITAFAPTSVRERRMPSRTSGSGWRDSITAKIARRAAAPVKRRIVCGLPQPASGASTTP